MLNISNSLGVYGGPTVNKYRFLQLHMHWNSKGASGSEHKINSKQYAAEVCFKN